MPLLVSSSVFGPGLPRNTEMALFRCQEACRTYVVGQHDVGENGAQKGLMSISNNQDEADFWYAQTSPR